jgi:hypothetical protein
MLNKQSIPAVIDNCASTVDIKIDDSQHIVILTVRKQIENVRKKLNWQLRDLEFYTRSRITALISHTFVLLEQNLKNPI